MMFSARSIGVLAVLLGGCGGGGGGSSLRTPEIVAIGDLPGGAWGSYVVALSADGSTALGASEDATGGARPVTWTEQVGLRVVTPLLFSGRALAISNDKRIVMGSRGQNGFKIVNGVYSDLPVPAGSQWARPQAADAAGRVFVGATAVGAESHAVIWKTNGVAEIIFDVAGGQAACDLVGLSANGMTAVGTATDATGARAAIWTAANGLQVLPLAGNSTGRVISSDGRIIVGEQNSRTFIHTIGGATTFLPTFPNGGQMPPICANAACDTILGIASNELPGEVWSPWIYVGGEGHLLVPYLAERGLPNAFAGWTNIVPYAVSADGKTIAGAGTNLTGAGEGWVLRL